MSRRPWLAASVLILVAAAGCDRGDPDPQPPATNPPTKGATCDDPTGDLSLQASELGGNLREPAGVDITHAEARVTDTTLRVSFTTAGPIAGAPVPEFRLAHGLTGQADSFELLATPPESGVGPWELRLATFRPDGRGGIGEIRTLLPVDVKIEGNTLSYEVPRQALPSLTSYVWQFGSSATANDTVIDVCDSYGPGAGPTTSAPAPPLSSTPVVP